MAIKPVQPALGTVISGLLIGHGIMHDDEIRQLLRQSHSAEDETQQAAEHHLTELVVELSVILEDGDSEQLESFLLTHPDEEELLRQMLPTMRSLAACDRGDRGRNSVATFSDVHPMPERYTLGDFRILREIGRGGMGVVYLAEQMSLHRQVALKTLPLAAMIDARQLQRFKNEVRAVAALDHPNIVSIYSVGEDRGIQYYAMQRIDGQSLAQIIQDLRRLRDLKADDHRGEIGDATQLFLDDLAEGTVRSDPSTANTRSALTATVSGSRENEPSTVGTSSQSYAEFYRIVARLGIQAARAVDYAHQQGITHRDIKPANLLIDSSATLFVTDFGLAQIGTDVELSHTGEMLGTPRYMSPEQARGERQAVTHRTDIYSLGATLYEMATLVPAFPGENRQQVLEHVTRYEPTKMRTVNQKIPLDLETIVMKAMAKEPTERYATAEDLAVDLDCFLKNRPIKAKRPSLREVALKWMTRNQAAVMTGVAVLILLSLTLAGGIVNALIQKRRADDNFRHAQDLLFAADVRLAGDALANSNATQAHQRLQRHLPAPGQLDRRGFAWHYVASQINREELTQNVEADGDVCWIEYAPDNSTFVSGHDSGLIYIWSAKTGKQLDRLIGHRDTVGTLSISSDGKWLVSGDDAGTVLLWDFPNRRRVRLVTQEPASIESVVFVPNSDMFAVAVQARVQTWRVGDNRLCGTLDTKVETVRALAVSHHEPLLAAANHEGRVYLWNFETEHEEYLSLESPALSVAFSSDGKKLAVGTQSGEIKVCDVPSKTWLYSWRSHAANVYSVAFSGDGTHLLSAGKDTTVRVRDLVNHGDLAVYQGHGRRVFCARYAPDGQFIISGGRDGFIRLWRNQKERFGRITLLPPGVACSARLSNDASAAALNAFHRTYFVDTLDGALSSVPMIQWNWPTAWSKDGAKAVMIGRSHTFDPQMMTKPPISDGDGRMIGAFGSARRIVGQRIGSDGPSEQLPRIVDSMSNASQSVDWNGDGIAEKLHCFGSGGNVILYQLADTSLFPSGIRILGNLAYPASASLGRLNDDRHPDLVVATRSDNTVAWYPGIEFAQLGGRQVLTDDLAKACAVLAADVDDDGRCDVVAAGRAGRVSWFRSLGNGQFSAEMTIDDDASEPVAIDIHDVDNDGRRDVLVASETQIAWYRGIENREFESEPRVISTLNDAPWLRQINHSVVLWDTQTKRVVTSFSSRSSAHDSVAYASDSHRIAVGSGPELRIFREDGSVETCLTTFESRINDLQFSDDERFLAIAAGDSAYVWNTQSQAMAGECVGHENTVERLRFSPDGQYLASLSDDQSVCLWNVSNQHQAGVLLGHKHPPTAVCFTADGRRLATADSGGMVLIWDMATGQQLLELNETEGMEVLDLTFQSDSRLLAIATKSDEGTYLCTWDAEP